MLKKFLESNDHSKGQISDPLKDTKKPLLV